MGNGPSLYRRLAHPPDKLLARYLAHGCEHAFVLDTAWFQLLLHHPLALRCKIGSGRSLLAAARCSDRGEKQIPRDDSHFPKDNAAGAAAKGALRLFETCYRTAVTAFM